jgi:RNA:NAD 2'-phosphotransferase (TPT1/KptA family)
VHLSANIRSAAEAGHIHHAIPTLLEVDTARLVAAGETVWHAGITVYLAEFVPGKYLSTVPNDHPEYELARVHWAEEE